MNNASNKAGKFLGKIVKGATAAPGKTGNLIKTVTSEVKDGYRSVVPKTSTKD